MVTSGQDLSWGFVPWVVFLVQSSQVALHDLSTITLFDSCGEWFTHHRAVADEWIWGNAD
jgi:hypothetical protein